MDGERKSWVAAIVDAIEAGTGLDRAPGEAHLDPQQADGWPDNRQMPGEALRAALIHPDVNPEPRGLTIRAVRITGKIDLAGLRIPYSLRFIGCAFQQPLDCSHTYISGTLRFDRCLISSLNLNGAEIKGHALLDNVTAAGEIEAANASIAVWVHDSSLINEGGTALSLDGAEIKGPASLASLTADGEFRALGANIAGLLNLQQAKVTAKLYSDRPVTLLEALLYDPLLAVNLTTAKLGDLALTPNTVKGTISLAGARINVLTVPEKMRPLGHRQVGSSSDHRPI